MAWNNFRLTFAFGMAAELAYMPANPSKQAPQHSPKAAPSALCIAVQGSHWFWGQKRNWCGSYFRIFNHLQSSYRAKSPATNNLICCCPRIYSLGYNCSVIYVPQGNFQCTPSMDSRFSMDINVFWCVLSMKWAVSMDEMTIQLVFRGNL